MNLNRTSTPAKCRNDEKDMEITASAWIQPHLLDEGLILENPEGISRKCQLFENSLKPYTRQMDKSHHIFAYYFAYSAY